MGDIADEIVDRMLEQMIDVGGIECLDRYFLEPSRYGEDEISVKVSVHAHQRALQRRRGWGAAGDPAEDAKRALIDGKDPVIEAIFDASKLPTDIRPEPWYLYRDYQGVRWVFSGYDAPKYVVVTVLPLSKKE